MPTDNQESELRAALEPFAALANGYESFDGQHDFPDDFIAYGKRAGEFLSDLKSKKWSNEITVGDLRRARAALSRSQGEGERGWRTDWHNAPTDGSIIFVWDTRSTPRCVAWTTDQSQFFPQELTHWMVLSPPATAPVPVEKE